MSKCTTWRVMANKPNGIQESISCKTKAELTEFLDTKAKEFPDGTKINVLEVTSKVIQRHQVKVKTEVRINRIPEVKRPQVEA